jgi:phosphatidylglycerol:prolipoprotein diacylglycerol transferase
MLCIAAFVILVIMTFKSKNHGIDINNILACLAISFPLIVLGGKTIYIISVLPSVYKKNISMLELINKSGFVFYGGLFGLLSGLKVYTKLIKQPFIKYTNFITPYIPLSQAFGRIGCFLNGCCYGKHYSGIFHLDYPVNNVNDTVFPVQLFESVACILLSLLLFTIQTTPKTNKLILYLTIYSAIRFLDEFYRGDTIRGLWFGLSTSQWISLLLLFIIIIYKLNVCKGRDGIT